MRYVALLRGINVGGGNKLKMSELKEALAKLGYGNIVTYIQSGNIAFNSEDTGTDRLAAEIKACISDNFSLNIPCVVLPQEIIKNIVANTPFTPTENKFLHFTFFDEKPSEDKIKNFMEFITPPDECLITDLGAFVHCPNGYSKTKLTYQLFEKTFGLTATARNWNTCLRVCHL